MSAPTQRPPPPKPRSSDAARPGPPPPGVPPPPTGRKASGQPAVSTVKQSPKFYDGPTVSAKAGEAANKAKSAAGNTVQVAKNQSKRAVAKVRRHPWGFASLLTTIPFLVVISLFSTVLCPPPKTAQSGFSRLVTSRLGLHSGSSRASLHETLCYPANVYHREVLQPYVYPILDDLHLRAQNHPAYVNVLEPAYTKTVQVGEKAWKGPVRPVVRRVQRGFRRFWFKFVEPHLPYLRSRVHSLTAPYTARVSALHKAHVQPHVRTASKHASRAGKQAADTYKYVAAHPVTGRASKYASQGAKAAHKHANKAYTFTRPHAIRAANEVERIAREVLGPQVVRGLEVAGNQVQKAWTSLKAFVDQQYRAHLEPHVGPYVAQVNKALAPHLKLFRTKVYSPYIHPALKSVLPASFFAPAPRSFWSMMADFLPIAGSNAAAQRGSMNGYAKSAQTKVADKVKQKTASVKASSSSVSKSASSATASVKSRASAAAASASTPSAAKQGASKKEIDERLKSLKTKMDTQGDKSYKNLKAELVALHEEFVKETLPKMNEAGTGELQRESEYVLKGLDKLFSSSTSLTKDQVSSAGAMAEGRMNSKAGKVRERIEKQHSQVLEEKRNALYQKEANKIDTLAKVQQREVTEIKGIVAGNPSEFSKRELDQIPSVSKAPEEWKGKLALLRDGKAADRSVKSSFAEIDKAVKYTNNDLTEIVEAFKDRVRALSKTANERIDALANVRASSSSSSSSAKSTKSGGYSILPVVEAAAADGGIGAVIGKGKEQVMDALSQASEAAASVTGGSANDVAASASKAAQSVKSVAADSAPSVEAAQGKAQAALGAVMESVLAGASVASASASSIGSAASEAVASATDAAAVSAASLASAGKDTVHSAKRSAMSAVGARPSPEGMMEHLESIANGVAQGAASVYGMVEENVHSATRSAIKAVGATPSPETPVEYAQSLASEGSKTAVSVASEASKSVGSAVSVVSASASSAFNVAASAVSSGLGDAPFSVVSGVQALASSASASAESIASAASSVVHDATRSAMYAAEATPSPEGAKEHIESATIAAGQAIRGAASAVSASAASVAEAAASVAHDGTRSAIKAVGGTPSPETPLETLEAAALAASASVASAYDAGASAVADKAAVLGSSIRSALSAARTAVGGAVTPTPEPLLSSASAYLAGLTAPAAPTAASGILASGSSILASLQSRAAVIASDASASAASLADEAGRSVHSATRAASRAVGASPTPETAGEILEDAVEKVKRVLGRDEL